MMMPCQVGFFQTWREPPTSSQTRRGSIKRANYIRYLVAKATITSHTVPLRHQDLNFPPWFGMGPCQVVNQNSAAIMVSFQTKGTGSFVILYSVSCRWFPCPRNAPTRKRPVTSSANAPSPMLCARAWSRAVHPASNLLVIRWSHWARTAVG
jgi:hypothetical protein